MDEQTAERLAKLLSQERLRRLIECTDSMSDAVERHQEILGLGGELMKVIATIEIALRNTVAANLRHHFGAADLFHPPVGVEWRDYELRSIEKAVNQARRAVYAKLNRLQKAALDRDLPAETGHFRRVKARQLAIEIGDSQVITELTLNFWKRLYSRDYEHQLWRPTLKRTFPNRKLTRSKVAAQLEIIYQSRNRLAHHEPVLHNRFRKTVDAIRFVIGEMVAQPGEGVTPLSQLLQNDIVRVCRSGERLNAIMRMPELRLILSERFDTEAADAVRAALSKHLPLGRPQFFIRRSADPALISFIQLVGDAAAWLPLSAAAAFYLSALAKRAGDATWDGIASLFKRKEVKPLADVAMALATAANKADGEVEIIVGLNVPDDYFGTVVRIKDGNPEAVAYKLAVFVIHAEELSKMMQTETTAGRTPIGQATVEVQDEGSLLVKWRSQPDFEEHERHIGTDAE